VILHWSKTQALQGIDQTTFMGSLLICLIVGSAFLLAFIAIGYVFRIDEIVRIINRLKNKLRKR
jgi:hypothetical protein